MLVLDANILIRGVLGRRVRSILEEYASNTLFFAPDLAFAEARKHLPVILDKRGIDAGVGLNVLELLTHIVQTVDRETYSPFEPAARQRLKGRDENDWPVLATSLALGCPIWTEDADFFGAGVATWTTDRVELFLRSE
jgi:predicted nucleic acid-binding protein